MGQVSAASQSPAETDQLLQPIVWRGAIDLRSEYFHVDYQPQKAEEGEKGSYEEHHHFLRRIRDIECYEKLLRDGHIVVLERSDVVSQGLNQGSCWIPGSYARMGVWKAQLVYKALEKQGLQG